MATASPTKSIERPGSVVCKCTIDNHLGLDSTRLGERAPEITRAANILWHVVCDHFEQEGERVRLTLKDCKYPVCSGDGPSDQPTLELGITLKGSAPFEHSVIKKILDGEQLEDAQRSLYRSVHIELLERTSVDDDHQIVMKVFSTINGPAGDLISGAP